MSTSVYVRRIKWLSFAVEDGNSADCAVQEGVRRRGNWCRMTRDRGPRVDCGWPGTGDFGFLGGGDFGVLEVKVEHLGCVQFLRWLGH